MGGAYSQFIENGILYRLFNCDDIEIFADRKLYLCVTDTPFYPTEAFHMDEATGLITEAKDFDGLNILFDLPLDPAKADPERAKQYIDSLWNDSDDGGKEIPSVLFADGDNGIGAVFIYRICFIFQSCAACQPQQGNDISFLGAYGVDLCCVFLQVMACKTGTEA